MSIELAEAMEKTAELFESRSRPEDWGMNIVEGSKGLKTERDWTLYYSYLFNPKTFNKDAVIETINPEFEIEPLPKGLVMETQQNGTETIINVRRVYECDEKDESVPLVIKQDGEKPLD